MSLYIQDFRCTISPVVIRHSILALEEFVTSDAVKLSLNQGCAICRAAAVILLTAHPLWLLILLRPPQALRAFPFPPAMQLVTLSLKYHAGQLPFSGHLLLEHEKSVSK